MNQTLGESIFEALGEHDAKYIYFDANQLQRLRSVDDLDSLRRFLDATRLKNVEVTEDFDQTVRNIATVSKDRAFRKRFPLAMALFNVTIWLCSPIINWIRRGEERSHHSKSAPPQS